MNKKSFNLPDFQTNDKLFCGLDLAKKDSQLAVLDKNGTELANFRFPSTKENFLLLAENLRSTDTIALEVSTSANAVMSLFKLNSDCNSLLSNPMQTKVISNTRCKTDKVDARVLVDLARVPKSPVARKLIELVWTMLTRNEEFIYAQPKRTDNKRALVKQMARRKANLKLDKKPTNRILYGTNLRGKEIRNEIQKRATNEAARIADLLDLGKKLEKISPTGFNPRWPNHTDWQKLLTIVAEKYSTELAQKADENTEEKSGWKSDRKNRLKNKPENLSRKIWKRKNWNKKTDNLQNPIS